MVGRRGTSPELLKQRPGKSSKSTESESHDEGEEAASPRKKSPKRPNTKKIAETSQSEDSEVLGLLRGKFKQNSQCGDCGAANPDWAHIQYGALLCAECANIHLLHLEASKVKYSGDKDWQPELIEVSF